VGILCRGVASCYKFGVCTLIWTGSMSYIWFV